MKRTRHGFIFLLIALLSACDVLFCTTETYTYTEQVPIYLSAESVETVRTLEPQPLLKPGKLYWHGDLLLINELGKGVHVIDNSDPTAPAKLSFISVPGNHDLLVRQDDSGTVLYADNYMHLVSLDISDPQDVKLLSRVKNVFRTFYPGVNEKGEILVGYEEREKTERHRVCPGPAYAPQPVPEPAPGDPGGGPSQGGSLARFAALGDYLYTIDGNAVQTFRLETLAEPRVFNRVVVDFGIETLFPYTGGETDQLYIGGNSGMYIYDASDPANLKRQGSISHVQSCDPVVVQEGLAYVTLQGSCFDQQNRLEIIDVSNPSKPRVLSDYALQEPYGLGVDGDYLFICDGQAGLKVYDNAREPGGLTLLKQFGEVQARDVIPFAGRAVVVAENGFFQYDYSALPEGDIKLLSSILVDEAP